MYKVYITKEEFNVLKKNVKLLNAIRLLRIDSAITTLESLMARTFHDGKKTDPKDDTSRDKRDRLEIVQYYGAVLYESIKTMYQMRGQLEQLNEYKSHINDISYLFDEWSNPHSFTQTTLKKIRNKLTFHFDKEVFQEAILDMDLPDEEFVLFEGDSEMIADLNCTSIPTLYWNYLISSDKENGSEEEKVEYIHNQMRKIFEKLKEVIDCLAGELLRDIVHFKKY
jgi:hypothetical protein